jgi:hypothetical protein
MFELNWEIKEIYSKAIEKSYNLLINPQIIDDNIEFHLFHYDYLEYRIFRYYFFFSFLNIKFY